MANYFFPKDFAEGRAVEKIVAEYLRDIHGGNIVELERKEQHTGDFYLENSEIPETRRFEVKFDKMGGSTGNLCFEVANGKGEPTGIASTQADTILYAVPGDNGKLRVFWFKTRALRDWLFDPINSSKIRIVNGGDKRAFSLMLVSIDNIRAHGTCYLETEIDA